MSTEDPNKQKFDTATLTALDKLLKTSQRAQSTPENYEFAFTNPEAYKAETLATPAPKSDDVAQQAQEYLALESEKRATLAKLDDEIKNTLDPDTRLRLVDARRNVAGAHSKEAIREAISAAAGALSSTNGTSNKSQEAAEVADRAQINAMDRRLFETDAVYHAETVKITAEANKLLGEQDSRQAKLDALAQKYGITTEYDQPIDDMRKKIAEADAEHNSVEARRLQNEMSELQIKQNAERAKKAPPEGAAQFHSEDAHLVSAHEQAMKKYEDQTQAFIAARKRQLEKGQGHVNPEGQKELDYYRQMFAKQKQELSSSEVIQIEEAEKKWQSRTKELFSKNNENHHEASTQTATASSDTDKNKKPTSLVASAVTIDGDETLNISIAPLVKSSATTDEAKTEPAKYKSNKLQLAAKDVDATQDPPSPNITKGPQTRSSTQIS